MKLTALQSPIVRRLLFSADSMAWSYAALQEAGREIRKLGRELGRRVKPQEARQILAARGIHIPDPNDWRLAQAFALKVHAAGRGPEQLRLHLRAA